MLRSITEKIYSESIGAGLPTLSLKSLRREETSMKLLVVILCRFDTKILAANFE